MFKPWKINRWGIVFLLIVAVWFFVIGFSSDQPGHVYNKGQNAIWIGHKWVGEYSGAGEVQKLVNNLKENEFSTVFVHVGPVESSGNIAPEKYQYALNFLEKARLIDKDIKYQAWMGQVRGKINLSDEEVRHNVANLCMMMTHFVGFDGIHFDIEPVWDGDEAFIDTLEECRGRVKPGSKISVALAEFIPRSFIWLTQKFKEFENYNTEVNYRNVGQYADQIIAMTYDTGFQKDWTYRWLVREQVVGVTKLFKDKEVFVAIPAYEEKKPGFDPEIENVESGMRGIINGLNNSRSRDKNFAGVAIYPYWEFDEDEIKTYRKLWLNK